MPSALEFFGILFCLIFLDISVQSEILFKEFSISIRPVINVPDVADGFFPGFSLISPSPLPPSFSHPPFRIVFIYGRVCLTFSTTKTIVIFARACQRFMLKNTNGCRIKRADVSILQPIKCSILPRTQCKCRINNAVSRASADFDFPTYLKLKISPVQRRFERGPAYSQDAFRHVPSAKFSFELANIDVFQIVTPAFA